MGKNNICPLCGEYSNQIRYIDVFKRYEGVCDTCGKFSISEYTLADVDRNKIASYLYYHSIFDESAQSFKTNFSIHRKQEKVKENDETKYQVEVFINRGGTYISYTFFGRMEEFDKRCKTVYI